jgi:hypothetical protein
MEMKQMISSECHEYENYVNKLKFNSYIERRRENDKILNEISKIYGKDAVIIYGDWGAKGRTRKIKVPNTRIKNLISKHFTTFLIDEYKTSKINCRTREEHDDNKKIKIGKHEKKLHSVYTFKMGSSKSECKINRDYNACNNMYDITKELVKTKERPIVFRRDKKVVEKKSYPVSV